MAIYKRLLHQISSLGHSSSLTITRRLSSMSIGVKRSEEEQGEVLRGDRLLIHHRIHSMCSSSSISLASGILAEATGKEWNPSVLTVNALMFGIYLYSSPIHFLTKFDQYSYLGYSFPNSASFDIMVKVAASDPSAGTNLKYWSLIIRMIPKDRIQEAMALFDQMLLRKPIELPPALFITPLQLDTIEDVYDLKETIKYQFSEVEYEFPIHVRCQFDVISMFLSNVIELNDMGLLKQLEDVLRHHDLSLELYGSLLDHHCPDLASYLKPPLKLNWNPKHKRAQVATKL